MICVPKLARLRAEHYCMAFSGWEGVFNAIVYLCANHHPFSATISSVSVDHRDVKSSGSVHSTWCAPVIQRHGIPLLAKLSRSGRRAAEMDWRAGEYCTLAMLRRLPGLLLSIRLASQSNLICSTLAASANQSRLSPRWSLPHRIPGSIGTRQTYAEPPIQEFQAQDVITEL